MTIPEKIAVFIIWPGGILFTSWHIYMVWFRWEQFLEWVKWSYTYMPNGLDSTGAKIFLRIFFPFFLFLWCFPLWGAIFS